MNKIIIWCVIMVCLSSVALADRPLAYLDGDEFVMPYSTDGLEHRANDSGIIGDWAFYAIEYDPEYEVRVKAFDNQTIGIRIEHNPRRPEIRITVPMEFCIMDENRELDGVRVGRPSQRCIGLEDVSVLERANYNAYDFTLMPGDNWTLIRFREPFRRFQYFIGGGAGGGGGPVVGCTPICSPCYATSINHGTTPSSVNTETNFNHRATVVLATCTGCQCVIDYRHKPTTQYTPYSGSYPSTFSYSVAKMVSGSNPRIITASGTYTNVLKCGGMHGSLYLRLNIEGSGGTLYSYKTVTCTDAASPTVYQLSPANNTQINSSWINFSCTAADNTGLKYIDLYHNQSGTYTLNQSQSYGNLVYNATKTFSVTGWATANNTGWECRARDTRSPNNDAYTGKRYFNVYVPILAVVDDNAGIVLGFVLIAGSLSIIIMDRNRKKKEVLNNGS